MSKRAASAVHHAAEDAASSLIAPRPKRAKTTRLSHATPSCLVQAMVEAKKHEKEATPPPLSLTTLLPELWDVLIQQAMSVEDYSDVFSDGDVDHAVDEQQYVVRLLGMVNKAMGTVMAPRLKPSPYNPERPLQHWWFWIGGHRTDLIKNGEISFTATKKNSSALVLLLRSVYDGPVKDGMGSILNDSSVLELLLGAVVFGRVELVRLLQPFTRDNYTNRDTALKMAAAYGRVDILAVLDAPTEELPGHLKTAVKYNQYKACHWLVSAAGRLDANRYSYQRDNAMKRAAKHGRVQLLDWLIRYVNITPTRAIEQVAAEHGQLAILDYLATLETYKFGSHFTGKEPIKVLEWYRDHHLLHGAKADGGDRNLTIYALEQDRSGERLRWLAAHDLLDTRPSIFKAIASGATPAELTTYEEYGFHVKDVALARAAFDAGANEDAFRWCLSRVAVTMTEAERQDLMATAISHRHLVAMRIMREDYGWAWRESAYMVPSHIFDAENRPFLRFLIDQDCPLWSSY